MEPIDAKKISRFQNHDTIGEGFCGTDLFQDHGIVLYTITNEDRCDIISSYHHIATHTMADDAATIDVVVATEEDAIEEDGIEDEDGALFYCSACMCMCTRFPGNVACGNGHRICELCYPQLVSPTCPDCRSLMYADGEDDDGMGSVDDDDDGVGSVDDHDDGMGYVDDDDEDDDDGMGYVDDEDDDDGMGYADDDDADGGGEQPPVVIGNLGVANLVWQRGNNRYQSTLDLVAQLEVDHERRQDEERERYEEYRMRRNHEHDAAVMDIWYGWSPW